RRRPGRAYGPGPGSNPFNPIPANLAGPRPVRSLLTPSDSTDLTGESSSFLSAVLWRILRNLATPKPTGAAHGRGITGPEPDAFVTRGGGWQGPRAGRPNLIGPPCGRLDRGHNSTILPLTNRQQRYDILPEKGRIVGTNVTSQVSRRGHLRPPAH